MLVNVAGLTALEAKSSFFLQGKKEVQGKPYTFSTAGQWETQVHTYRFLCRTGSHKPGLEDTTWLIRPGDTEIRRILYKNHNSPCTPRAPRHLWCLSSLHPMINVGDQLWKTKHLKTKLCFAMASSFQDFNLRQDFACREVIFYPSTPWLLLLDMVRSSIFVGFLSKT